jgi:serine/threonine protein kinase
MSMIGKTLAHYEITSQLGKGGMGEVYRAKDLKLGRDVAIKVLPEEFARDADRVARFQREAKLLASLNHPNIAAIHGLEESEGTNFLVLELVEGETLADRIKAGPIPVEESLKLALQIAEALEAAHGKGVIHRDLKPSNIKVTPDGKVKVLDFGLAKAYAGEQADLNLSKSPTLTYSPTLSNAATEQGVILGTAAYMSPEQARGKAVDKRADIWAFGCVLYEMLTGQAAFQGEDVTEILASVVKGGANLDLLPANLHPRMREVITRCLQKDLKKRYQDIGDVRYEIEQVLADPSGVLVQPIAEAEPRARLRTIVPWIAAAIVLGAIIAGASVWKLKPTPPPEPRQVVRFDYNLSEGQKFSDLNYPALAVSPDGKQFVYSTPKGLYLRSVDELAAKLISGTEGATEQPFFSPDGKSIGYFSAGDRKLKKIALSGGTAVTLCAVTKLAGAWWSADDTIAYGQYPGEMMRISANGGTPDLLVKVKARFGTPGFPQILPDGKSVLYTFGTGSGSGNIMVGSPESVKFRQLFEGSSARYLPTGHVVYESSNSVYAIPFDLSKLKASGSRVPLIEGVKQAAISDAGTLVYIPQTTSALAEDAAKSARTLVWVDYKGKEEAIPAPPNLYRTPRISPDGTRVAITIQTGESIGVWVLDLISKTLKRLTFEGRNFQPVWTPDSKRIAFCSDENGDYSAGRVSLKAADGTGQNEPLSSKLDGAFFPSSWSSDATNLVGVKMTPDLRGYDIGMLSMEGDHPLKPVLQTDYLEVVPRISPNGQWMAYCSDESNPNAVRDIFVRSFPDVNKGHWQISTSGGNNPLWSPDGRELFYIGDDDAIMAVSVKSDPSFSFETPRMLFRGGAYVTNQSGEYPPWDISPDGKRFLMIKQPSSKGDVSAAEEPRKINIVLNWLEELKKRVPVK